MQRKKERERCGHAKYSMLCQNERVLDRQLYRNQTELYASTLCGDVLGTVEVAPEGSEHSFFVYHRD
jgi:hypothetical protein